MYPIFTAQQLRSAGTACSKPSNPTSQSSLFGVWGTIINGSTHFQQCCSPVRRTGCRSCRARRLACCRSRPGRASSTDDSYCSHPARATTTTTTTTTPAGASTGCGSATQMHLELRASFARHVPARTPATCVVAFLQESHTSLSAAS